MNMKNIYTYLLILAGVTMLATSCDEFLDEMPDNRTEIDSEDKIAKLLVAAYPDYHANVMTEIMSDNVDDFLGSENQYSQRFTDQYAFWEESTETDVYDNPLTLWQSHYNAIATANQALAAIEELGSPASLDIYKGEALLCRAYCHFVLATIFCMPYNPDTAAENMGIPYADRPETTLNPSYERGTLAETYDRIDKDLTAGLPLCGDEYSVPKYHFNRKAAYGFASRFYLFYQQFDRVIECANAVLGVSPADYMHNWEATAAKTFDADVYAADYIDASSKANLLLATGYSMIPRIMGPFGYSKRFTTTALTDKEILEADGPWGTYQNTTYFMRPYVYNNSSYSFVLLPKYPNMFQYTDAVQGIGLLHSIFALITGEEVLLNRAEAYVLKGEYTAAAADLYVWQRSRFKDCQYKIVVSKVNEFYTPMAYYRPLAPTVKHLLHPQGFTIEAGTMENMIHCVLQCRRMHFLHEGMRWFDCNRYGIDIYRRLIGSDGTFEQVEAELPYDDLRRAVQLPYDVISAGMPANPRTAE